MSRSVLILAAIAALVTGPGGAARAQEAGEAGGVVEEPVASADCAQCHGSGEEEIAVVTETMLETSVHAGLECLDCHSEIEELPHDEVVAPVNCAACHDDVAEVYVKHGRGKVGVTADLPTCTDCHGTHEIRAATERDSPVNPINLPGTCGRCHDDLDLALEHDIRLKKPVESYRASIHGRAVAGGIHVAATCDDCHSSNGSSHRILGPGDPESSINHFRIAQTCGKCHHSIEQDYSEGIHGKLAARGEADTPVCTTCHGEHGILPVDDPRSRVSPILVAEATCTPCHEAAFLNEKYGIPAGRLASFVDSYHGLKSMAGDTRVANCTSCHGAHRILPSADPESSVNPDNLKDTCGHCHPGISAEMASVKIHESGVGLRTGWANFFTIVYRFLIVGTIGGMLLYVGIDFRKKYRSMLQARQVRRMDTNAVVQHMVLTVSFVVLVITGFALRFHDGWLISQAFAWDGGFAVRGIIHRTAASVFLIGCIWHLFYLRTRPGRQFWQGMMPSLADARMLWQMILYNLDRRRGRPRFGRFSYVEKVEYWALIWGSVIMSITGLFLWFDNYAVRLVPKGFLNVMLVIHYYEAVLATLAIAVWHLYSTVFSPDVYPGNPSWLTGKMPAAMHAHEHPEDTAETAAEPKAEDAPEPPDAPTDT